MAYTRSCIGTPIIQRVKGPWTSFTAKTISTASFWDPFSTWTKFNVRNRNVVLRSPWSMVTLMKCSYKRLWEVQISQLTDIFIVDCWLNHTINNWPQWTTAPIHFNVFSIFWDFFFISHLTTVSIMCNLYGPVYGNIVAVALILLFLSHGYHDCDVALQKMEHFCGNVAYIWLDYLFFTSFFFSEYISAHFLLFLFPENQYLYNFRRKVWI